MLKNLKNLSAFEISHLLSKNKINPILLLEYYLERYNNANKNTQLSFTKVLKRSGLKEATLAWKRQKENQRLGPLDGMPIGWKDVIDISNAPAFAGSKLLKNNRNIKNISTADVVKTAKKNGLVSIAKTSTVEFAFGGIGINQSNPLPKNLMIKGDFAAGGSSTGSATAVYAGLLPFAVGTDTAGSVRIPAAWHGLVGFKPTYDMISTKGVLPLATSYDTVGIICKCIKDTQLLFSLLANKYYYYPNINTKEIKIAVVNDFNLKELDNQSYNIYENFFTVLSKKGFHISRINIPEFREINNYLLEKGSLVNYEAWESWKALLNKNKSQVDDNVLKRFMLGKALKRREKDLIEKKIKKLINIIFKKISDVDVLATPTINIPPPSLAKLKKPELYNYYNQLVLNNTRIANICNFTAITFPILKLGSQCSSISLFSKANQDKKLLSIAEKIESILL